MEEKLAVSVKYFSDTGPALVEFTDNAVADTKEVSEKILDPGPREISNDN
jgi:hypothetical protein